jgi:hypothetical protein
VGVFHALFGKEYLMNRLLAAALTYAAHGWMVLPLHTPGSEGCSCGQDCGGSAGKHPRTPHGLYDASRQPDQLWRWWHRWPNANVGIRTGQISGLVILDVDVRHSGQDSLERLQSTYAPLPPTLTAQSGGGGSTSTSVIQTSRSATAPRWAGTRAWMCAPMGATLWRPHRSIEAATGMAGWTGRRP